MKCAANNRKGFTLVEIMVVLALTVVILGLVFGPVISSFNFTRRAETMVRAQDNARFALEEISRELADAMYVYDNTNQPINFPMLNYGGSRVDIPVLYAKVDIVLPRMRGFCTSDKHPAGQREFPRHDPDYPEVDEAHPNCPICGAPLELRPAEPLAADRFIVRYFIGLRDPSQPYKNGFTNKLSEGEDNMFVLYRVEFSPYDERLFGASKDVAANLSDPNFFYGPCSAAWRRISRPIVTLENTDLIVQEFSNGDPVYVAGKPVITPTVKFAPTAIYNDPLLPTADTGDTGEHGDVLPTVYKATYGYWTTPIEVTLFRGNAEYKAVRRPGADCILYDPSDHEIFNISDYMRAKANSDYSVGVFPATKPGVAFTVDETRGTVDFAFPVVDVNASNSLSGTLGRMAVSMIASTDDINRDYDPAWGSAGQDRYRKLIINDPALPLTPIADATVVAGSERVVAPDATPGSSGRPIRYSRVPNFLYEPGLNQYQLDAGYEPVGGTASGLACLFFHSYQTHQPGTGVPLPSGTNNLYVYYEVQNNKKGDSLRANYVTKSLMTVIMGIRVYDPSSGKPQAIQLTNKVRLRNIAQ